VFLLGAVLGLLFSLPALAFGSTHLRDVTAELGGELGLGVTVLLWLWLLHRRSMRLIGLPENVGRELRAGVLGGVAIYTGGVFVIGTIVSALLRGASNRAIRAPHQLPTHLTAPELVIAAIAVIVVAPVAEELFFRGMLFRSLRARHTFAFAGPVSALCFGAAHYQGGAWQNALLLPIVMVSVGLGLAWLYERRGNIVANMAAHATFNVIGFLFIALVTNH